MKVFGTVHKLPKYDEQEWDVVDGSRIFSRNDVVVGRLNDVGDVSRNGFGNMLARLSDVFIELRRWNRRIWNTA